MNDIRTVGVAGCGTMGAGIAIVAARAGFRTIV
jgi:3-hydroxybutyryl-CoA dehydrogenase